MRDEIYKIFTLLRLVAFMVIVYLALGWLVERYSRVPDSRLKGFFRLVCSPLTQPVARLLGPDVPHRRVLGLTLAIATAIWIVIVLVTGLLRPS